MKTLTLLFTKDGITAQRAKNKAVTEQQFFSSSDENTAPEMEEMLEVILQKEKADEMVVISALNHFTLMPEGFSDHDAGYDLIAYNAPVEREREELMLSINKKCQVQFYYTFPKEMYQMIKNQGVPVRFNFSGEKFLTKITARHPKEIHINLYQNQCEFFAFEDKKIVLYNNLDVDSEVDFLYFIMFTLSKIGFGTRETYFFVYGETTENETFISELQKFVQHLKIVFDNLPKKNFILN